LLGYDANSVFFLILFFTPGLFSFISYFYCVDRSILRASLPRHRPTPRLSMI
jgi:hypothetical protein